MQNSCIDNARKLIVLVPDSLADNFDLVRRIHLMAVRDQYEVLYLTLVDNESKRLEVSRSMATMKANTQGKGMVVQSRIVETSNWLETVREVYQPGDLIVCHAEQTVKTGFLQLQRLDEYLNSTFRFPTITLSGFYHPGQIQLKGWLRSLIFWVVFLLIALGFGYLEIQVEHTTHGTANTLALLIIFLVEFGVFLVWNHFSSHLWG